MKTAYLLGAGATREDYPLAPLGEGLLDAILRQEPQNETVRAFLASVFDPDAVERHADAANRPRLDDVLTLIDASLSKRSPSPAGLADDQLIAVRDNLIAEIGRAIGRGIGGAEPKTSMDFADFLVKGSSVVISTNYDIVMDNALFYASRMICYGVPIRERVERTGAIPDAPFARSEAHHFKRQEFPPPF